MAIPYPARFGAVDAFVPLQLLLPGKHPEFMSYTIAGGQTLPPGAVLGLATSGANSGKLVLSAAAAGDGSQNPMAILPIPVSTYAADGVTAQDQSVSVYVRGYFNAAALFFGTGQTIANTREALRAAGILTNTPEYSG